MSTESYWQGQAEIRQGIIVSERRKAARLQAQLEEARARAQLGVSDETQDS